jgi:hypothetical protein
VPLGGLISSRGEDIQNNGANRKFKMNVFTGARDGKDNLF